MRQRMIPDDQKKMLLFSKLTVHETDKIWYKFICRVMPGLYFKTHLYNAICPLRTHHIFFITAHYIQV